MTGLETFDWIILAAYFLILASVVWWSSCKQNTSQDYFLAGRNIGWFVIGASLFASNIGSEHIVGLAGNGAKSGMAMAHWELHAWIMIILAWVFVPFYYRSKVFTIPEFLEKRFNSTARWILSIVSLVAYIFTKVSVTVYAGGIVFKEVFGIESIWGIDFFWFGAIGLVIITGIYTVIGGMKSVLYTSVLQTPILLGGSITIVVIGLIKVGGWSELEAICSQTLTDQGDSMMGLMRSPKDPEFPWTGVILGSAIIGFWYWCTDQYIVQRVLSGRNQKQSRRGTIFGAYLKLLPVFIFLIPGMIAFALNEKGLIDLQDSDSAFPLLVSELLPIGLKGVVVGGLLAALMSSLASLFNSSAALFTVDFYKRYKPESTEKHLVYVGRMATIVIVALGIAWIPVMKGIGKVLYEYLQDVQSLLAPGIASVFLLGVFWKRATPKAGFAGLATGFVLGMVRLAFNIFGDSVPEGTWYHAIWVAPNWLHYEIVLFGICLMVIFVVSFFTERANEAKLVGVTFYSTTPEQRAATRASYNKWDVINSIVIIAIIIAFYIKFWN